MSGNSSSKSFARSTGYLANALFAMGRVVGSDNALLQQADVSSIAYRVMDSEDATATPSTGSLTVADTIFDTPQTSSDDSRWPASAPSGGYNFGGVIPGSAFAAGGKKYFVQVDATLSDSSVVTLYGGIHTTRDYF